MNNNALFLLLGGVGLYMLTRTKTSAPVNPGGLPTGVQSYTSPSVVTGGVRPASNYGQVLTTVTGAVNDAAGLFTTIKNAVGTIKSSLPSSTPSSLGRSITYGEPSYEGAPIFAPGTDEVLAGYHY